MQWIYLLIAVVFEIIVAIAAGKSEGFKNGKWTAITLVSGVIATIFLSLALLTFDVGVGYSMWTALAGVGIVALGAVFFNQRLSLSKGIGILIVIGGVVGLRMSGAA
ncbi:DMT family transporter [Leisingera sp.]|uniref:DMT family transporter n=1 Tax=Leisingera sp. TaxID=1879318 RepID=UPI002B276F07|nr:SMR family transporter [Leisingera sp.]